MKQQKMLNTNKGITLIALVITIIVMLILVAVTISMAVNGGLFEYASNAGAQTNAAIVNEQELANLQANMTVDELIDKYTGGSEVEPISTTESYVGYYADVNGDKIADGVIYADLAKGGRVEPNINIPTETGLKDYYISGTADGAFGNGIEVLTALGEGKDRFYVMALSDISTSTYTYYESKLSDGIELITSPLFGKGKENTATMIAIWNADIDEAKSSNDVWGHIQTRVNEGWFLPSMVEWLAFEGGLGITSENYGDYGLNDLYLTSSQYSDRIAVMCAYVGHGPCNGVLSTSNSVRLSATF